MELDETVMERRQLLANLEGYDLWDIEAYPLQEKEAGVVIRALRELDEKRAGEVEENG